MFSGALLLVGEWEATVKLLDKMYGRADEAADRAIRDEAVLFLRAVQLAFRKGGVNGQWRELGPIARALRRGTKPLMDQGDLWRSVNLQKVGDGEYFVGVSRTAAARARKGSPLINVAEVHETGAKVIPVTDKMRRYFRALYWKKIIPYPWPPASARYIRIPRRSFLADTFEKHAPGYMERLLTRYGYYLIGEGSLGTQAKVL